MAASMRLMRHVFGQIQNDVFRMTVITRQMSKQRRGKPVATLTPEDEAIKLINSQYVKVRDPKQNAETTLFTQDPVLSSLSEAAEQKSRSGRARKAVSQGDFDSDSNIDKLQEKLSNTTPRDVYYDTKAKGSKITDIKKNDFQKNSKFKQGSKKLKNVLPNYGQSEDDKSFHWDLDGIKYSKLKEGDKKFGRVLKATKSRNEREATRQIVLEGRRLIEDALAAGGKMLALFFTRDEALLNMRTRNFNAPVFKVYERHLLNWSETVTPPGLLALFEMPDRGHVFLPDRRTIPLTMVFDNIRDPGNMGTLIRTAAAVGCQNIITTKGCVDVWDPKVLRSAVGSHFRVPLHYNLKWENVSGYVTEESSIYVVEKRRPTENRLKNYKNAEFIEKLLEMKEEEVDVADSDISDDEISERPYVSRNREGLYYNAPLRVIPYSDVNFAEKGHVVLVIGGEVHGVSPQARKLAFDHYGDCLTIPMSAGVDSLNAGIAGSLLMYEVSKKLNFSACEQNDEMNDTEKDRDSDSNSADSDDELEDESK